MKTEERILYVPSGIRYISEWIDENGQYVLDHYFSRGRYILNKDFTGCGFTTYCLINNDNLILVSPRLRLIQDKMEQFKDCFYYDREPEHKKSEQNLMRDFHLYYLMCCSEGKPMKLLVTYDSFASMVGMIESLGIDVNTIFRIAVDESHCLIKDVSMKECRNKNVLSKFLSALFKYDNLLFASATPIIKYIRMIPEFQQQYQVDYYKLEFPPEQKRAIQVIKEGCKSSLDAFDRIYNYYDRHADPHGEHYFDVINHGNGNSSYSREAVIFLNSVNDIKKIVKKYVKDKKVFKPSDITIICANTPENRKIVSSICPGLKICDRIPKTGEPHTKITLVTRTGFEGVDFCSTNASTYVIANYHIRSLSLDISSDLPQIVGRQRLEVNLFRNTVHVFYTNGKDSISDEEFDIMMKHRMDESNRQIALWNDARADLKDIALQNISAVIDSCPDDYCLKIEDGMPKINYLIEASERYSKDILQNYQPLLIQVSQNSNIYSPITLEMIERIKCVFSDKINHDRIKEAYPYFQAYPQLYGEFLYALRENGFNDIGKYFNNLTLDRILALGYDTWKMDREIENNAMSSGIRSAVKGTFVPGFIYSKKEIKSKLQEIFRDLGIKRTAKAKEIENYMTVALAKKDGINAYRIIG